MDVACKELSVAASLAKLGTTRRVRLGHNNAYASCPIFKLHHDILLAIFQINADMDQDPSLEENQPITKETPRAINATRDISQVTSRWRNLILNSPTVWANLIDFHVLESAGEYWREEVIRRTQNSPVHFKGSISLEALGDSAPWWLEFLNGNWARIRKFDLVIKTGMNMNASFYPQSITQQYSQSIAAALSLHRQALQFLTRRTSTLESFRIVFPYTCDLLQLGITLFNNHAPRLRHFRSQNLRFNNQNSWIFQLQTLHVHESKRQTFPSMDVLYQILSRAPSLESLSIKDALELTSDTDERREPIHLPRLRYLNIRGLEMDGAMLRVSSAVTSAYWNLLNNIIPRHDCSVRAVFSVHPSSGIDFQCTVSRLAKNYFKAHAPTYLELSADRRQFRLTDLRAPKQLLVDTPIVKMPFFDYNFYNPAYSNETALSDIFEALFFLSFSSVVDLHLEIGNSKRASLSNPQFGDLLSSFSSTEKLTTTPATLRLLSISPNIDISTLFPQLKLLQMPLERLRDDYETDVPLSDILMPFLMAMKEAGTPIATYYYQCARLYVKLEDLRFLEEVTGLKVIWENEFVGSGEYVCGSGRPEELNFLEKWRLVSEAREMGFRRLPLAV